MNELTAISRNSSNTLTVAGTTTSSATNVTVNTSNAVLYLDRTFASTNHGLVNGSNSFTAIAKDSLGRRDTNSITVYLPTNAVYAYDLNGNLTNDSAKVFEYDDENQLTRVTKTNEFKKEYIYDGKMRLRVRKEFAWRGGVWTKTNEIRFIWDGDVIVQQRDANNLPTLTFTRGTDLSGSLQGAGGIGGLLAYTDSRLVTPASFYYHADGNGNITMLIDANQKQVAKYLYDSFGIPLSVSGSQAFVNPIWFSSQCYDWDTGFLHYKYRIYIPQIQRWLNRDPIVDFGFQSIKSSRRSLFNAKGWPLYQFVFNKVTSFFDAFGLNGSVIEPPVRPPTIGGGGGDHDECQDLAAAAASALEASIEDPFNINLILNAAAAAAAFEAAGCGNDIRPPPRMCPPEVPDWPRFPPCWQRALRAIGRGAVILMDSLPLMVLPAEACGIPPII